MGGDPSPEGPRGARFDRCVEFRNQAGKIIVNKTGAPTGGSFGFDTDVSDGNLDGNSDNAIPIGSSFNTGDIAAGTYHINELLTAANAIADPDVPAIDEAARAALYDGWCAAVRHVRAAAADTTTSHS